MPRPRKTVEAALKAKGFRQIEGDHHYFIYFTKAGLKSVARTKTSHSGKDVSDPILSQMARQCKLTKPQFLDLVDCEMNQDQYEKTLSDSGQL